VEFRPTFAKERSPPFVIRLPRPSTREGGVFDASQGVQSGTLLKLSQTMLRTFSLPAVTEIEARCSFSSASPIYQLRFVIHHIRAQIGNPHTGR
jgi:hypothetical protein